MLNKWNERRPGSGEEIRFEIIEHLIQARLLHEELRKLFQLSLHPHEELLAPDFDEDKIFEEAYKRTLVDMKNSPMIVTQIAPAPMQPSGQSFPVLWPQASAKASPQMPGLVPEAPAAVTPTPAPTHDHGAPPAPPPQVPTIPGRPGGAALQQATPSSSLIGETELGRTPSVLKIGYQAPRAEEPPVARAVVQLTPVTPGPQPQPPAAPQAQRPMPVPIDEAPPAPPVPVDGLQNNLMDCDVPCRGRGLGPAKLADSPFLYQIEQVVSLLDAAARTYQAKNKVTYAYLKLKEREVDLRAVREFLDHIERDLASFDRTPLFQRIDRRALVLASQKIQDSAPGFLASVPGYVSRQPLPPIDTVVSKNDDAMAQAAAAPRNIRLPRFYAENQRFDKTKQQAEFELILGLSRALPDVDDSAIRENKVDVLPELRFYNDNGLPVETPSLSMDRDLSSSTFLVYRFSPEFGETGWYTAALLIKEKTMRRLSTDSVNYTFSVASTRPNFRLTTALMQMPDDPDLVPPPPRRGLVRAMDRRARIEVQVYGGTSVLGASLRGVLHKLDEGKGRIIPIAQDFHDDGETYGDREANDGVYTTLIPLNTIDTDKEYRLLIQADSTPESKNIAPEDPGKRDEERRKQARDLGKKDVRAAPVEKVTTPEPQKAVIFQRATSIQIRVEH